MKYLSVEFLCKEYKSEKRSCSSAKKSREFISYLQNNSVGKKRYKEPELKSFSFLRPEKCQVFILSGIIPEFHFMEKFSGSFYKMDFFFGIMETLVVTKLLEKYLNG